MMSPVTTSPGVTASRVILWTFLLSTILFPQIFQPVLSIVWKTLYTSTFYNLSTFETVLTVTSYAILEPWYTYMFARRPDLRIDIREGSTTGKRENGTGTPTTSDTTNNDKQSKRKSRAIGPKLPKMRRLQHRVGEIVTYIAPLLLMDLTMIKKFAGVPLDDIRVSGGYPPFAFTNLAGYEGTPPSSGNTSNITNGENGSIHATFLLPTLHNFTHSSPLQLTRALPPTAPTSRLLTLQLLTSLLLYDFLFFTLHLSLHTLPLLARIHLPHHTHTEIHPQVTNRLSTAERLSLVLLANFSLNIIGAHVLTRTLFVPVFVDLLIQVHCGMDLPFGYEKFLPRGWGLGCVEHARHHRTGGGCYAPFFGIWDGVLGSVVGRVKGERGGRKRMRVD